MPLVGVALLGVMLGLARVHDLFPGDEWALVQLAQYRGGWLDDAAVAVSGIGKAGIGLGVALPWIPLAVVAVTLAARSWGDAAFLVLATLAPVFNLGLKALVARPRPDEELSMVLEAGYGFPSGHAVFAAAFLGALMWLAGRWRPLDGRAALRWSVIGVLALTVLAVGASRVYLGVHWPSDVIAGLLFGAVYLGVFIAVRGEIETRLSRGWRGTRDDGCHEWEGSRHLRDRLEK